MYFPPWTLSRKMILWNRKFFKLSAKHWKMLYNRELLLKTLTVASSRFNVFIAFRPCRWTAAWGEWSILIPTPDSSPEFQTNFITETRTLVTFRSIFFKLNLVLWFGPVITLMFQQTLNRLRRGTRGSSSSLPPLPLRFISRELTCFEVSYISRSLVVNDLKLFWHSANPQLSYDLSKETWSLYWFDCSVF